MNYVPNFVFVLGRSVVRGLCLHRKSGTGLARSRSFPKVVVQKLTEISHLDCGDYFWPCLISFRISLGKDLHLNCRKRSLHRVQKLNLVEGSLCNNILTVLPGMLYLGRVATSWSPINARWTALGVKRWQVPSRTADIKYFLRSWDHSMDPFLHLFRTCQRGCEMMWSFLHVNVTHLRSSGHFASSEYQLDRRPNNQR